MGLLLVAIGVVSEFGSKNIVAWPGTEVLRRIALLSVLL